MAKLTRAQILTSGDLGTLSRSLRSKSFVHSLPTQLLIRSHNRIELQHLDNPKDKGLQIAHTNLFLEMKLRDIEHFDTDPSFFTPSFDKWPFDFEVDEIERDRKFKKKKETTKTGRRKKRIRDFPNKIRPSISELSPSKKTIKEKRLKRQKREDPDSEDEPTSSDFTHRIFRDQAIVIWALQPESGRMPIGDGPRPRKEFWYLTKFPPLGAFQSFMQKTLTILYRNQIPPWAIIPPPTGLFGGGHISGDTYVATIDYVQLSTSMHALSFGNLTSTKAFLAACSDTNRGLFAGGFRPGGNLINIDYVTIATVMDALNFGNLTVTRRDLSSCSNTNRGLFAGGFSTIYLSTIDYVTIATTMNALGFGNLSAARRKLAACSSDTRGLFGGGQEQFIGNVDTIDYVTIATTMNALNFGDLAENKRALASCSTETRGLFAGGTSTFANVIEYVTIASTMNALDFGDLTLFRGSLSSCSNTLRGLFAGGFDAAFFATIDCVNIATTMNATFFGDLSIARRLLAACSKGL